MERAIRVVAYLEYLSSGREPRRMRRLGDLSMCDLVECVESLASVVEGVHEMHDCGLDLFSPGERREIRCSEPSCCRWWVVVDWYVAERELSKGRFWGRNLGTVDGPLSRLRSQIV